MSQDADLQLLAIVTRHPTDYVLLNEQDGTLWRGTADGNWKREPREQDRRQQRHAMLAQLERCMAVSYGAGHHYAQHGEHDAALVMQQAEADAALVRLIEEYARHGNQGQS